MTVTTMEIKSVLVQMVESMLPRFSNPDIGLYFCIDMCFSDYGFSSDGNTRTHEEWDYRKKIEFIIHRPSNYTKVLVRVSDFADESLEYEKEIFEMEKHSDHDSCWREDGFQEIFQIFMDADKQYKKDRPDRNRLTDWNTHHGFSIFSSPKYVKFETFEPIRQDNGYVRAYKIKIEKFMNITEAAKYLIKKGKI